MEYNEKVETIDETQNASKEEFMQTLGELGEVMGKLGMVSMAIVKTKAIEKGESFTKAVEDKINAASEGIDKNSKAYEKYKDEISKVKADYKAAYEKIASHHLNNQEKIQLEIAALQGKMEMCYADIRMVNEEKAEYVEDNSTTMKEEISDTNKEITGLKKEIMKRVKRGSMEQGDLEEASRLLNECKEKENNIINITNADKTKIEEFDQRAINSEAEIMDIENKIAEMKEFSRYLEDEKDRKTNEIMENRDKSLANVKSSKSLFEKAKMFLSKTFTSSTAKTEKFYQNTLKPMGAKVNQFIDEKIESLLGSDDEMYKTSIGEIVPEEEQFKEEKGPRKNFKDLWQDAKDYGTNLKIGVKEKWMGFTQELSDKAKESYEKDVQKVNEKDQVGMEI